MARAIFGQTWWGKQWLNALTNIDFDNRLPRGRTYANNGSVTHFSIRDNAVRAHVVGSQRSPYKVAIDIPAITQEDIRRLFDDISTNPAIIARLLNHELDPLVLKQAEKLNISLFPQRWQDLHMACSCPDWAVPCKHIAAVIYLLSREIDSNPFLVFSLRDIHFEDELRARNIIIEHEHATESLPSISALLAPLSSPPPPLIQSSPLNFNELNFSSLEELSEPLICVLSENPSFFHGHGGDFREVYKRVMLRVTKSARAEIQLMAEEKEGTYPPFNTEDLPRLRIDDRYIPLFSGCGDITEWPTLMLALTIIKPSQLLDYQPEIAALYYAQHVSLQLLAHGAVVPEIFSDEKQKTRIRWLPAMLDKSVRHLIEQLSFLLPSQLIEYKHQSKTLYFLPVEQQTITVCSIFITMFIKKWASHPSEKLLGDKIFELFFTYHETELKKAGENQIAASIQVWLSRFYLANSTYTPVLCLDESQGTDQFALALAIEGEGIPLTLLSTVLNDTTWMSQRFTILKNIMLLAEFFPPIGKYIGDGARSPILIDAERLASFLFDTLPIIRLLGIRTLLPKGLDQLLRPRLSMKISSASDSSLPSFIKTDDLFNFKWQVALGEMSLTQEEFEDLVKKSTGIVRFRGHYIFLDPTEIERLRRQLEHPPELSSTELLHTALAKEYEGAAVVIGDAARAIIKTLTETTEIALPQSLNANLRPYQARGFSWLYRNARIGFGSVIADDMGLGKTLQVITLLLKLKEEHYLDTAPALVIVPTSLLTNWQKEIERFAPQLSVAIFHGAKRVLQDQHADILLTTYGIARTEANTLKKITWHVIIIDEAQNIKNPSTAQTKAIKTLRAKTYIAMSGTPVENRLSDYWSIMDFANRGYLNTLTSFKKIFAAPIQMHHDQQTIRRFREITAPFLLRRLKSDKSIISDLPEKIEQNQFCELSPTQTALYESVLRESLRVIEGESEAFKRQGLVLQMILALKQICNHPINYLKEGEHKAMLSGKGERFLDLLEDIHNSQEKVLVFTQFREMGDLLSEWVAQHFGKKPLFLHGGVSRSKRDDMVESFQNDRTHKVFILSLKAGGTGLNLTAASHVIHYDLWWNPAVEAQATDRAYRIGQQKNVQVHRFITRSTFEERINDMIQHKRLLADLTVETGEKWIGQLNNEELNDLFSLRKDKPSAK